MERNLMQQVLDARNFGSWNISVKSIFWEEFFTGDGVFK